MKTWIDSDQGFLIECRALQGRMTLAELYVVDDVPIIQESISAVLVKFEDMFEWPKNYLQGGKLSITFT